eukprot:scaffold12577_cov20-Tisochrysis_lutea.AAC.1
MGRTVCNTISSNLPIPQNSWHVKAKNTEWVGREGGNLTRTSMQWVGPFLTKLEQLTDEGKRLMCVTK